MCGVPTILGVSALVRSLEEDIVCAAEFDARVLITGESGVGKHSLARRIHALGHRHPRPMAVVACAGVAEARLESDLFGDPENSGDKAAGDRAGLLQRGDRSSVFVDDIGEMSLRLQARLLRFCENGEVRRPGAEGPAASVDTRIIAATQRSLPDLIARQRFRADLYYRLNIIHIEVPPVRARREDIPFLLHHFLREAAAGQGTPCPPVADDAVRHAGEYAWPGNLREIRDVSERLVKRCTTGTISRSLLQSEMFRAYNPRRQYH